MEKIKVSFEIDEQLYIEWCKKPVSKNAKQKRLMFIATQVFGIVVAVPLIVTSIIAQNIPFLIIGAVFLVLFGYRLFFRTSKVAKKYYKMMRNSQKTDKWIRTFTFENGKIKIEDANSVTTINYSDILRAQEDENIVYLIQNNDMVFRLPKNAFLEGTPAQLLEALNND